MSLIERVRRYACPARAVDGRTRVLWLPCRADPIRSRSCCLLRALAADRRLPTRRAAHLHHHIRGAAADGDAAFCRHLAARLGLPAAMWRMPMCRPSRAEAGVSLEVAGRDARQRFYVDALRRLGGSASRSRTRATTRRKPCCCAWREAPARRACRAWRRAAGTSCARCSRCRGPSCGVPGSTIGESWREDATNADWPFRAIASATTCCRSCASVNAQADAALARAAGILAADADVSRWACRRRGGLGSSSARRAVA